MKEKINHLICIDDIKLLAKNSKELETDTNNKTIQPGYRGGIWHRKVCHTHYEKWKNTNNRRNRNAKSRKNQNVWRKGKLQVLGNGGSAHHQTSRDKKKKKRIPLMDKEASRKQTAGEISSER